MYYEKPTYFWFKDPLFSFPGEQLSRIEYERLPVLEVQCLSILSITFTRETFASANQIETTLNTPMLFY
jgi:hypothetical protein